MLKVTLDCRVDLSVWWGTQLLCWMTAGWDLMFNKINGLQNEQNFTFPIYRLYASKEHACKIADAVHSDIVIAGITYYSLVIKYCF